VERVHSYLNTLQICRNSKVKRYEVIIQTRILEIVCVTPIHVQVICTQPRKIAATSLAERVAMEYASGNPKTSQVGTSVGYGLMIFVLTSDSCSLPARYRTGGFSRTSKRTVIEFMTEGTLLKRLCAYTESKRCFIIQHAILSFSFFCLTYGRCQIWRWAQPF
jgi:hypothetical protein